MTDFVHSLLSNTQLANVLTPMLTPVINILTYKGCKIVRQIDIDYDLVEVKPYGVCFSFSRKTFAENLIAEEKIGLISPRAYVSYTFKEDVVPYPRLFVDSLRNSMPDDDELLSFLQKWYQLALKDKFPQKAKKLCCVGEADSGKTSWFAPYEGIISQDKLASVTRDTHFSASMLNPETECLFVDEWPPDALTADDAKRILQGGYVAIPQKHKEAVHLVYRSGIYITCNEIPPFSGVDEQAIRARITVFETKSLKKKNPYATGWLRKHCMQCFHWAAERLRGTPLWSDEDITAQLDDEDQGALYNDFTGQNAAKLIDISEIEQMEFSQDLDAIVAKAHKQPRDVVPSETVDRALLVYEDENTEDWMRPENEAYVATGDINEFSYHKAVFLVTMSKRHWKELNPNDEDLERFRRRRKYDWSKSDSMYDAWLLIENTPRKDFDIQLFKERFPQWEALMEKKYGTNRESHIQDASSQREATSDEEDDIFITQSTPPQKESRRRPNTMIVRRRAKARRIEPDSEDE